MADRRFAAIDVGSFDLEMGIYEIDERRGIRLVDSVRHVIALGSDTYNTGMISFELVEELVDVLRDFTEIMRTYKVSTYRAYATSALREAKNRILILDKIRVRTGLEVKVISNAEARFLSYKALAAQGEEFSRIAESGTAIADLGFGSMQISLLENGALIGTQNLRLGALRVRTMLSSVTSELTERDRFVGELVDHELETYSRLHFGKRKVRTVIALGDMARLLRDRLMTERDDAGLSASNPAGRFVDSDTLREGCRYLSGRPDTEIEAKLGVNSETASIVVPAAIIYQRTIEMAGAEKVWIPEIRLIDGIAAEYAFDHRMIPQDHDFDDDIISTVREITHRYGGGDAHRSFNVANTLKIFDALKKVHGLTNRDRLLLQIAAMFHHCGQFISMSRAGLSSYDIVRATELIGLSEEEHELVADVVRNGESSFDWTGHGMREVKLTAMILLANALDRSAKQKGGDFRMAWEKEDGELVISTRYAGDMTLEQASVRIIRNIFTEIFGAEPVLRQKRND